MQNKRRIYMCVFLSAMAAVAVAAVITTDDKYMVKVPGGLAFSEFRGYESWQAISVSRNDRVVAMILGNQEIWTHTDPVFRATARRLLMAPKWPKFSGFPKKNDFFPGATVPGKLANVDFMVKDSRRFADSGGWGYAVFDYDAAADALRPGTLASTLPQGNDARCAYGPNIRSWPFHNSLAAESGWHR
jgi:hypothetical protein